MDDAFHFSFYDENDKEIGRQTYNKSLGYGRAIYHARKRGEKKGAVYMYQKQYLRRFNLKKEE